MFPHIFQENDLLRLNFFGSAWLAVRETFALQANDFVVAISNQFLRLGELLRNDRNRAILARLISLIDIGVPLKSLDLHKKFPSLAFTYLSMMRFFISFSSTTLLECLLKVVRDVLRKLWPDSSRCIMIWRARSRSPLAMVMQYLISMLVHSGKISCKRSHSSKNKSVALSVEPSLVSDKCWIRLIWPLFSSISPDEVEVWLTWRPSNFSSGIKSLNDLKNLSQWNTVLNKI